MKRLLAVGLSAGIVLLALIARPGALVGLIVVAAVLVPCELAFALHRRGPFRPGWRTDVVHFLANSLLTNVGVIAAVVVIGVPLLAFSPDVLRSSIAGMPAAAQFGVALLIAELVAYWAHRAAHEVPGLWRFHKVHHASEHLDWLAAAHLHPVDQIWIRSCAVIPLFVLGFSRATFGGYLVFATFHAIFVHANVRLRFGPLRWLIVTPEYHHWHHANEPAHRNRNYAAFPFVDALFGTLHLPARWPNEYGVDEPQPASYLGQLRWSFR